MLVSLYVAASVLCLGGVGIQIDPSKPYFWYRFFRSDINLLLFANVFCLLLGLVCRFVIYKIFLTINELELIKLRDMLTNFIIFRVVFVVSILRFDMREIIIWNVWFAFIGCLRIFVVILRERCEEENIQHDHRQLKNHVILLSALTCVNLSTVIFIFLLFSEAGLSVLLLMWFENVVICLSCIAVAVRYGLAWMGHYDVQLFSMDFAIDAATHFITLAHLVHIWSFHSFSFNLIDLCLMLNVRSVGLSLFHRVMRFLKARQIGHDITHRYADATPEELAAADDICAICRDRMREAKKLPCNHMFHVECLRQSIQYQSICPICRLRLDLPPGSRERERDDYIPAQHHHRQRAAAAAAAAMAAATAAAGGGDAYQQHQPPPLAGAGGHPPVRFTFTQVESVFRFSTQDWAPWIPSFSFDVVRGVGPTVIATPVRAPPPPHPQPPRARLTDVP